MLHGCSPRLAGWPACCSWLVGWQQRIFAWLGLALLSSSSLVGRSMEQRPWGACQWQRSTFACFYSTLLHSFIHRRSSLVQGERTTQAI